MEPQTSEFLKHPESPTSEARSLPDPALCSFSPSDQQLASSFPILRFPRPQGSPHLANWVSNSSPDIRQPVIMSDTGSLADSGYEMIHGTDLESQDGRTSESTDAQSLDDFENHYNTDSDGESDDVSNASSIRYADQVLQSPSSQLPASNLEHGSASSGSAVVVGSIDLRQGCGDDPAAPDHISAKHAVREFSEEESFALARELLIPADAPRRLVASVHQTLSPSYLSTQEPLRMLYVGRADAQRKIVLKICSAIWASPKNGGNNLDSHARLRDGLFNIVPVSSFGPSPELDLIESSRYQIKVEHCTSAEKHIGGAGSFLDDSFSGYPAYSLTIDQEKVYTSNLTHDGPTIVQEWDLPHVAVFYCSARDDAETQETRDVASSFMNRHGVPSIFITEEQEFHDPGRSSPCPYIDRHAVHLCLESRDLERPIFPVRFPIDYPSFADIDPRQLNRNLAFVTGLCEPQEAAQEAAVERDAETPTESAPEPEAGKLSVLETAKQGYAQFLEGHDLRRWIFALVIPILLSLLVPLCLTSFAGWLRSGGSSDLVSLPSTGICLSPSTHPRGLTTSKISSVATTTTTVVINVTSTKTVQISQAKPSTSALASALSFAGLLSDKPSAVQADSETPAAVETAKKTVCSVQVSSPTELLVAIPSRNKAVWLAKGAIDITVRRSEDLIKTKLSLVDEGLLVELAPKDAYGQLNVSVVTSRRPKVNETFLVDFGKTSLEIVLQAGAHLLQEAAKKLSSGVDGASAFIENTARMQAEVIAALERTSAALRNQTAGAVKRATDNVREHMSDQLEPARTLRKEIDLSILRAQVASRLWWLKIQGRDDEFVEYERNASRYLKMKVQEVRNSRGGRSDGPPKEAKSVFAGLRTAGCSRWRRDGARPAKRVRSGNRDDHGARSGQWRKWMGRL